MRARKTERAEESSEGRHPPVRLVEDVGEDFERELAFLVPHVHDDVAHGEKLLGWKSLREEIGYVVSGADKRHDDLQVLHTLTNEKMSTLDMFHFGVMLWVVGDGDSGLVVYRQSQWMRIAET